jgi:hypothetical protein
MNLGEIRTEVKLAAQDSGFSDQSINDKINEALMMVAGRVSLPSLKRIGTATTNPAASFVSFANIAGGFSGRLIRVFQADGTDLAIAPSLELLMEEYGILTTAGDIEACCLEGNTLWYAYVPAVAETLTLLYFQNPRTLADDTDEPVDLPEFSHRSLLVNGTCFLIYDLIERGVEGAKVNTREHEGHLEGGIIALQNWLGRNKKHQISSVWSV